MIGDTIVPPSAHAYGGVGPDVMGGTWALAAISTGVVVMRAYVARKVVKRLGWDLFWVVSAWFVMLLGQITLTVSVAYGMGNDFDLLTDEDGYWAGFWSTLCQYFQLSATQLGRIAIVAFILHIQGNTRPIGRWFLHFVWFSCMVTAILQMIQVALFCKPMNKLWYPPYPGRCDIIPATVSANIGYVQSGFGVAGDLALAVYPGFIFGPMQMSMQRKLGLCVLMGGGLATTAVAIFKTLSLDLEEGVRLDFTRADGKFLLRSSIEIYFIIILGSIPQIYPLFARSYRKVKPYVHTYLHGSRSGGSRARRSHIASAQEESIEFQRRDHYGRKIKIGTNDNESEENILPPVPAHGISVKSDYSVHSHQLSPGDERAMRMI